MSSQQQWKTELYDNKLSFVSGFGEEVVGLLNPIHGESILDLGCGTGDLANLISKSGAIVSGIDYSEDMIQAAKVKYPDISFQVGDAANFHLLERFDAVFSNAALHWVKNAEQAVKCIWDVLNSKGRFVAEFGGKGNVEKVVKAIHEVLDEDYGLNAATYNPWYFPSIAEYCTLLERQGFHVTYAVHFERPTRMEDGEQGLSHWLSGFADVFFRDIAEIDRQTALRRISLKAKNDLFKDGSWYVDYKRIRIIAIKD